MLVSVGLPLTTAALSPFTNPYSVEVNVGILCPAAIVKLFAVTVSGAGLTTTDLVTGVAAV